MDTYQQEIQLATFSTEDIMKRLRICQEEYSMYLAELERRAHIQAALQQQNIALTGLLYHCIIQLLQIRTGTVISADWQAQSKDLVQQARTLLHQIGSCLLEAGDREMIALLVRLRINELERLPLSERSAHDEQQLWSLMQVYTWIDEQMTADKEAPCFLEEMAGSSHLIETLAWALQGFIERLQRQQAKKQEEEHIPYWLNIWRLRMLHALLASVNGGEEAQERVSHQAL